MPTVFHPDHVSLDKLFTTKTRFIIPEYQRPYSWQCLGKSDRNNQINQMWEDLWTFFVDAQKSGKEYFFGSMVIIEPELRQFEVVDGQQRITSLTLLFAAMSCFLRGQLARRDGGALADDVRTFMERGQNKLQEIIYNEDGPGLAPTLKVKINRAVGNGCDFDQILNQAVRCEPFSNVQGLRAKHATIARRYFDNRDYFLQKLEEVFLRNDRFGNDEAIEFNQFFEFLQTRIAIVTIRTEDFSTAFNVFEILNNRGLPLTNKDLLRNFVVSRFAEVQGEDGAQRWEVLEEDYALTDDFIGRFVESKIGKQQRASAFNDLKDLYDKEYKTAPTTPKITSFYDDMVRNLAHYTLIDDPDGRTDNIGLANKIKFIAKLGNFRYSTNLMLALFRYYGCTGESPIPKEVLDFLLLYQQYAVYIQLAKGRRYSNKKVYEAIRLLLDSKPNEAREAFRLDRSQRNELIESLDGEFDNFTGKVLVAGFVWHEECEAGEDVVQQRLDFDRSSLEHIIPQNPRSNSHWTRDFPKKFRDEYTYKLGNMTLLTTRRNSSAGRRDFVEKKKIYRKTQLALTKALATLDQITPEFIATRHQRMVAGIRAELGL